jgi:hypothetical protein
LSPSTASGSWNGVRSINGNNDQQLSLLKYTPQNGGYFRYKIQYGGKFELQRQSI